jgi:isoleucyl-tRNA synthetase
VASVQLAGWPDVPTDPIAADLRAAYATVAEVKDVVTKALEEARADGTIGKSQEAALTVRAPGAVVSALRERPALADLFIVSAVTLVEAAGEVAVTVERAAGEKCPRCWNIRTDVGSDASHPEVCGRCARVLGA